MRICWIPHNHVQVDFDKPALPRRDSCSRFGVGFSALKLLTFAREYEKVAMELCRCRRQVLGQGAA